jgi:type II pantothenate kinase
LSSHEYGSHTCTAQEQWHTADLVQECFVPVLPQLRDVQRYRAAEWDLVQDTAGRAYWLAHFRSHFDVLAAHIAEEYPELAPAQTQSGAPTPLTAHGGDRLADLRAEYYAVLDDLAVRPERYGRLDVLMLDELRQVLLVRYGCRDPFRGVKAREDAAALALLPNLLRELDRLPPEQELTHLAEGLLAGNLFDLGAQATIERYTSGQHGFWDSRAQQPPHPWFVDHLDAWKARCLSGERARANPLPLLREGAGGGLAAPPYRHALWFVDNAGSDVVLGCLPLARWLLRRGVRVTLAANTQPALNDITAAELVPLLKSAAAIDPIFADPRLTVVASGNRAPLIDLTQLSDECVTAAADADLLMLHGMGRSIESNWSARFTCDCLRTAVLKDAEAAARLHAQLFDHVFRFEPGTAP